MQQALSFALLQVGRMTESAGGRFVNPQVDLKPRLRWLHFRTAPLAFVLGTCLLVVLRLPELRAGVAVYVGSAVLLFRCRPRTHLGAGGPNQ